MIAYIELLFNYHQQELKDTQFTINLGVIAIATQAHQTLVRFTLTNVMSWPNFRLLTKLSFYLVKL